MDAICSAATEPEGHPALTDEELAGAQRALVQDAAWASLIDVLSRGVLLVSFALLLGAGPFTIGLLGAIPSLAQLAQLPAIAVVERLRRRRLIAVGLGLCERIFVLLLALLPLLSDKDLALTILVLGQIAIAVLAAMSACSWNSWMHDLLPRSGIGAFFAKRLSWSTSVSLIGALAGGAIVDNWPGANKIYSYSVIFAVAGIAGFLSSWFLARVPEPSMAPVEGSRPTLRVLLGRPFQDRSFRRLIVFLSSWSFSTNLAAPFITVYLLDQIGLGLGTVLLLWAASQLANAITISLWGRLSDRFSDKAVLRVATPVFLLCLLALPLASILDSVWMLPLLTLIHVVLGIANGGTALASGNIGLRLAPRGEGTSFLAVIGLCNAAAAGLAPILGGLAAHWFASRELSMVFTWTAPGSAVQITFVRLHHWEFFFVLAALAGLHAIHALSQVPAAGHSGERILVRDLALEAARTLRSVSSVAGFRVATAFPFGRLVGRRPTRIRPAETRARRPTRRRAAQ